MRKEDEERLRGKFERRECRIFTKKLFIRGKDSRKLSGLIPFNNPSVCIEFFKE